MGKRRREWQLESNHRGPESSLLCMDLLVFPLTDILSFFWNSVCFGQPVYPPVSVQGLCELKRTSALILDKWPSCGQWEGRRDPSSTDHERLSLAIPERLTSAAVLFFQRNGLLTSKLSAWWCQEMPYGRKLSWKLSGLDVMPQTCNHSTQAAAARGLPWVLGWPGLQSRRSCLKQTKGKASRQAGRKEGWAFKTKLSGQPWNH